MKIKTLHLYNRVTAVIGEDGSVGISCASRDDAPDKKEGQRIAEYRRQMAACACIPVYKSITVQLPAVTDDCAHEEIVETVMEAISEARDLLRLARRVSKRPELNQSARWAGYYRALKAKKERRQAKLRREAEERRAVKARQKARAQRRWEERQRRRQDEQAMRQMMGTPPAGEV